MFLNWEKYLEFLENQGMGVTRPHSKIHSISSYFVFSTQNFVKTINYSKCLTKLFLTYSVRRFF